MANMPVAWNPSTRKVQLFWKTVDIRNPDECWICKNEPHKEDGRCRSRLCGWYTTSYRIAFILDLLFNGKPIPEDFDKLKVLHTCDNPPCCNPKHLFLGTQADNLADMRAKGRDYIFPVLRGEDHGHCKIKDNQIDNIIKEYYSSTVSAKEIANKYGISITQLRRLANGKRSGDGPSGKRKRRVLTDEHRKKIAEANKKRYARNHP